MGYWCKMDITFEQIKDLDFQPCFYIDDWLFAFIKEGMVIYDIKKNIYRFMEKLFSRYWRFQEVEMPKPLSFQFSFSKECLGYCFIYV